MAPIIARTRGGSEPASTSRRLKRPFSNKNFMVRRIVSSGEGSLVLPERRRKSSNATPFAERAIHASGLHIWMTVSLPTSFRGRLRALVETSLRLAVCVVNPRRFAAAILNTIKPLHACLAKSSSRIEILGKARRLERHVLQSHVPDTFQWMPFSAILAFLPFRFFNNLRVFNTVPRSNSPRLHHSPWPFGL